MALKHELYQRDLSVPKQTWAWNFYGAGLENFGRDGQPETLDIPEPGEDQLLVRIDSVGMCFSDVKIIKQGRNHPKLYNRDLENDPSRLGHEVALTIIKVGRDLKDKYHPGQRLAVQPDIYQNGKSTAYGYTIPGGLIQYHLIGPEVLDTDAGACLLPVGEEMGYAESSLLEPWGCVVAAYTQRRRLEPKAGGTMWIIGRPGDTRAYQFSKFLDAPTRFVLTDVPAAVRALIEATGKQIVEKGGLADAEIAALAAELTGGSGFDDIVALAPTSAARVGEIAKAIARRGTLNLVATEPLDDLVQADVGRLHYDYIAFVGTDSSDIAAAYGEARNRCELRAGGTAVFIGAGGPMGQMHVQRAIEMPTGPQTIVATEVSADRIALLKQSFEPLAKAHGRDFYLFNPMEAAESIYDFVMGLTDGAGADDVVVSVPVAKLMEEAATLMKADGMLVLFAGVPNGTYAAVDLSKVYLHNAQYTGTSGLTIEDQAQVMARAMDGSLSPERVVAAVGGLEAARDGIEAVMAGRYPGKIVIFPQIHDLPLMGLDELKASYPEIGAKLGEGDTWTRAAENALLDTFWQPQEG
ncbi:MAG: zinc-binding dehydrogenase [Anaerolineales bacterium]|nr:zinc-binding dehydrogenase [Anaerolineales bacterium]